MKLQSELATKLLEIPDVKKDDGGTLFTCQNQEIARIREDGFVDIKLTHPLIRALGLSNDEKAKDWIEMSLKKGTDFPAVIALVERAANASKRIRLWDDAS